MPRATPAVTARWRNDQKWRMACADSDERCHLFQAHGSGEPARLALLILAQAHDERAGGQVEPLRLVGAERERWLAPARFLSRELADDAAQLGLDRFPILLLVGREIERSLELSVPSRSRRGTTIGFLAAAEGGAAAGTAVAGPSAASTAGRSEAVTSVSAWAIGSGARTAATIGYGLRSEASTMAASGMAAATGAAAEGSSSAGALACV